MWQGIQEMGLRRDAKHKTPLIVLIENSQTPAWILTYYHLILFLPMLFKNLYCTFF